MPAKTMVVVPNIGQISSMVAHRVLQWVAESSEERPMIVDFKQHAKCNENNYQIIAKRFWESDCDFLLQFDADNPPVKNPLPLTDLDKDIIGLPTPIWIYVPEKENGTATCPLTWSVYEKKGHGYLPQVPASRDAGLVRCDAVGAGAILIARRVFQAPLMRREGWHRRWNRENGIADLGLDLAFCERARKCGFEIYAHWKYPCHHYKSDIDLLEIYKGYEQWTRSYVKEEMAVANA